MKRESQISDNALIKAIQNEDGSAAALLYYRHVDCVHRICYRIVLDSSLVKDCVQEVWFKVFRNLNTFHDGKPFVPWLKSITVNTAIDFYRKAIKNNNRIISETIPFSMLIAEGQTVHEELEEARIQEWITHALQKISVTQRTAFILRYYEDMPTAKIAQTLRCSENTVRTHIRRSLLALRKRLADKITR